MPTASWTQYISTILASSVVASSVSVMYTHFSEKRRARKMRTAQSLSLLGALEGFALSCAEYVVLCSEKLADSERSQSYGHLSNLSPPSLKIPLNVDFGQIDTNIACEALALPFLIKRSNAELDEMSRYDPSPIVIERSVRKFAAHGLKAWELSCSVRTKAKIPQADYLKEWDFLTHLQEAVEGR